MENESENSAVLQLGSENLLMALVGGLLGTLGQPIAVIGQSIWVMLRGQISYVKNTEKDFEKLKEKAIDLYKRREDVNIEINRDTMSKMPTVECRAWLQKVREVEDKVDAVETEIKDNKRCIGRLCPNIWWRRKLGKKIEKMKDNIVNLKDDSMFSGRYVVEVPPQLVDLIPTPTIEGNNTSINRIIQKILRCIKDDDKQKIGIWGMGGVGKTTAMKILNNSPQITDMFQKVIWVTVSKDGDVRKVQKDILKRLSLEFDHDESVETTASRIFQGLSKMKYLLLLDDLWQRMDLEDIGIPNPSRENGCKMIITTRSMVICNKMEIDVPIKVEVLSEEEAWNLFLGKVGSVVDLQGIREIATQVVRECQGLPLAIIVIGGSLRNTNDPIEWRNALKELRSNKYEIIDDMEESVFTILKFSYDQLKSKNIKNCFLYCALYPEDFEIDVTKVVQRWWTEGFIDDGAYLSLDEAYDKGHAIINYLKDVSLLEGVDEWRWTAVKMHDVIRDLASKITSSVSAAASSSARMDGNQFLVRTNMGIQELLNEEDWKHSHRISLMHNEICKLPENPTSLLLETLFLQGNQKLTRIPESFFQHMHNLRVLDLSGTDIRELPASVSNLVSLQGLYLLGCDYLITLPSQIGHLKKLQLLHLGCTLSCKFEYLPIEIQQLRLLRSLVVTFGGNSSGNFPLMIPNGIISTLSLLENLSILVENVSPKFGEMISEEVACLKQLNRLQFHFTTLESFDHFLRESCPWKNQTLKSFRFIVEYCNSEKIFDTVLVAETSRFLRVLGGNYTPLPTVSAEVLHRINGFHLKGHQTCQGLLDFGLEKLKELEVCVVEKCKLMEVIINGNDLSSSTSTTTCSAALPNLEYLEVREMASIRAIWEGSMPPGSFSGLACLNISDCENLRKIFTGGILQQLSNLDTLLVSCCQTVQVIVNEEEEEEGHLDVAPFPKLKFLSLVELPRLERIWKTVSFPLPSLERIKVFKCPNLKSLPPLSLGIQQNGSSTSSILKRIEGSTQWWEALEWEHDEIKQLLQPLFVHPSWMGG